MLQRDLQGRRHPKSRFATNIEEQYDRLTESFEIVYGDFAQDSQHDDVNINGDSINPLAILSGVDDIKPPTRDDDLNIIVDESVPFQTFPENGNDDIWLIPVGIVRWDAENKKFKRVEVKQKKRENPKNHF